MATTAVLTAKGRDEATAAMQGGTVVGKVIAWGLNPSGATAAVSDVALFKEAPEARVTGTASVVTTTTTNDTYQVVGTMTCTQGGGETIAECCIADSTTKPATTTWSTAPSTTSGTTGTLTSNTGFASSELIQDQDGEVMNTGTDSSGSLTGMTRGANGSTATTSANGNQVTLGAGPGSSVTGGNLLMHASFSGLPLNNNDSIAFTIQIKWT